MSDLESKRDSVMHWIYGTALLLFIGLFTYFVFVLNSSADTVAVTATVLSSAPTIDSIFVSNSAGAHVNDYSVTGINLNPGTTTTIYVNGIVSDTNTYTDVNTVEVYFHLSSISGTCIDDPNNCYHVTSCTLSGGAGLSIDYSCEVDLQYFADSTTAFGRYPGDAWVAEVVATDNSAVSGSGIGGIQEVNELTALIIPTSLNFGSLALSETTTGTNNVNFTLTQNGNNIADVAVSMTDTGLTCGDGSLIPRANIEWDLEDNGVGGVASNSLTTVSTDTDVQVPYRDDNTSAQTKDLYWDLTIPREGVTGTCSGDTLVSVIAG